MASAATGELRKFTTGWVARIRTGGKVRKPFTLSGIAPSDDAGARERCTAMAEIATRLRRAGLATEVENRAR